MDHGPATTELANAEYDKQIEAAPNRLSKKESPALHERGFDLGWNVTTIRNT